MLPQPLAQKLGVEEPDLSPLFTALGVACIISGTPSGWLVDRLPTHYVLVGSLLIEVSTQGCQALWLRSFALLMPFLLRECDADRQHLV